MCYIKDNLMEDDFLTIRQQAPLNKPQGKESWEAIELKIVNRVRLEKESDSNVLKRKFNVGCWLAYAQKKYRVLQLKNRYEKPFSQCA